MVLAVRELRQREALPAPAARQEVHSAPHPPVHVAPELQLTLEVDEEIADVERGVLHVTKYQLSSLVHCHSENERRHSKVLILIQRGTKTLNECLV